jgi:oxaloacetate decarboxylase beta subunit
MDFLFDSFAFVTWKHLVMFGIGIILIFLAIKKEYEPTLLLPMGLVRPS